MIGIQLQGERCAVAICTDSGPERIGEGTDLRGLVATAAARAGPDAGAAVAVPAWYNDEQRKSVRERVREAGIARTTVINEPTATTLAFAVAQAELPASCLVLSLSDQGAFDATVLALRERNYEVLAADGLANLDSRMHSDGVFASIEPPTRRALKNAKMNPDDLAAILLAGQTALLQAASDRIQAAFGRAPEQTPSPETAVARGAAVFSRMLDQTRNTTPEPDPQPAPAANRGCLGAVALVAIAIALLGHWLLR
jgi:molecular chaperone DnaK (HSP70)